MPTVTNIVRSIISPIVSPINGTPSGGNVVETFNIVDAVGDNLIDASGNFIVWSE